RNLHGECADAAGCAVDQNFLPRLDAAVVAQTLQRSQCRDAHGACLIEGYVRGFSATPRLSRTTTYSATAPSAPPNTSSPGLKRVTSLPTASTTPAKSTPTRESPG